MKIEHEPHTLVVEPNGDGIDVGVGGDSLWLTRDEARMLWTDLGQMLGTFELSNDS